MKAKQKKKTNVLRCIWVAALAVCIIAGTCGFFGYFTDVSSTTAHATAGTLDIELNGDGIVLTDENGSDIINPGDSRALAYTISNVGNTAADVRTTISLTSSVPMTKAAEQAEFELYNASDVQLVSGEGYKPLEGATPIATGADRKFDESGMVLTYTVDDLLLNGKADSNGFRETDAAATATNADVTVNADGNVATSNYVLVYNTATGNAFQDATIDVNVTAEAKQHDNTGTGWALVGSVGEVAGA